MTTASDVAVMRRLIRERDVDLAAGTITRESSVEVAVQIAQAGGACPLPASSANEVNAEVFDLLSSGWLRFWPPGKPVELRLDPELHLAFLRATKAA